jgi:hypothetical protein
MSEEISYKHIDSHERSGFPYAADNQQAQKAQSVIISGQIVRLHISGNEGRVREPHSTSVQAMMSPLLNGGQCWSRSRTFYMVEVLDTVTSHR